MWSISGRGQRLFKNTLYTSGVKSSWGIESFCEMRKKTSERMIQHFYTFFVNRSLMNALLLISFLQPRGAQILQNNKFPWITDQLKEYIFKKNTNTSINLVSIWQSYLSLSTWEERKDISLSNPLIYSINRYINPNEASELTPSRAAGWRCWVCMLQRAKRQHYRGWARHSSFQSFQRTRERTGSLSHY